MVQPQLQLITVERPWQLDPTTRTIGRAGLAQARAALAAARSIEDEIGLDTPTSASVHTIVAATEAPPRRHFPQAA